MKTPAGNECPYFFGDYYRGRNREECRLIGNAPKPKHWSPGLCKTCPVPGITQANACENMKLKAVVSSLPFGILRRVQISAFCEKSNQIVKEPHIGCGECHKLEFIIGNDLE